MEDLPLAVIDIDGVVADVRHRLHFIEQRPKQWDLFFASAPKDTVHSEGATVVARLKDDHEIVFLTGRPERCRRDTEKWLNENGFGGSIVYMRPEAMRIPSATYKLSTLKRLSKQRTIGLVVDDDTKVIDKVKSEGFPTFHADWEHRSIAQQTSLLEAQGTEGAT